VVQLPHLLGRVGRGDVIERNHWEVRVILRQGRGDSVVNKLNSVSGQILVYKNHPTDKSIGEQPGPWSSLVTWDCGRRRIYERLFPNVLNIDGPVVLAEILDSPNLIRLVAGGECLGEAARDAVESARSEVISGVDISDPVCSGQWELVCHFSEGVCD